MKHLGKIERVRFGSPPVPNGEIGLNLNFLYGRAGSRNRIETFITNMSAVAEALRSAGSTDIYELRNKPVEVEVEGDALKSWRVLTEVL